MTFEDRGLGALPQLYGAPAYSRPASVLLARHEPPGNPDDLPLEIEQTEEEQDLARSLVAGPWSGTVTTEPAPELVRSPGELMTVGPSVSRGARRSAGLAVLPRPFRIGALGGRLRGRAGGSPDANT